MDKNNKTNKNLSPEDQRTAGRDILKEEAVNSPAKMALKAFLSNKLGMVGLVGFLIIVLAVFVGSQFVEYDPYYMQGIMKNIAPGSGYMEVPSELKSEGIKKIDSGVTFSIGLSEAGKFYVWGHNPALNRPIPQEALDAQGSIKDVAAGDNHLLVVTEDGEIYGWGENNFRQAEADPKAEKLIADEGLKELGAGDLYSVVLTEEGTIYVWGSTLPNKLNMISPKYDQNIEEFEVGPTDILVRLKDGSLAVLGQRGTELDTTMPDEIREGGSKKVREIARMRYSGLAITEDDEIITWGARQDGIYDVPEIEGSVVKAVSGLEHLAVLTDTGHVYSWGKNNYGTTDSADTDGHVDLFASYFNNYALKDDGNVDTWGLDGFLLGSDESGRDLATRIIHGGKMTLIIAFVAVAIQVAIGVIVGMVAGFYGGWIDNFLMRFAEIVSSFPFYPLVITLSALLPVDATQYQRLGLIMVILGILNWPGIARLVRGEILSEREKDYITAAKALGLKEGRIMISHMLPNILSIIIVNATIGYASNLLTEASLSFLGFGVKPPFPSWGNMLTAASDISVLESYWWRWVFPGIAVFATALTVNLMGDALRDALDPKAQER